MTYRELFYKATRLIDKGEITLGEYETMTKPLDKEIEQEPTTKNDLGVDCIDRQIISDYVESHIQEINTGYGDLNRHTNSILRMIVDYIENMPSVTPQEPKTGHRVSGDLLGGLYCSECMTCLKDYFKYCPNCGAKMAESEDKE